jgi:hypothetical protein
VKELTEKPNQPETKKASKKPPLKRGRKSLTSRGRKTPAGQGATRLRDAVNTAVDMASGRIANELVKKTCDGNATIAGIVVKLVGADKAPPETKRKKRTKTSLYIQRLANEPEWTGPWEDESGHRDASKLLPSEPDWPDEIN